MGYQLWQSSAKMRRFEDVLEYPPEIYPRDLICKDRHRPEPKIERPNIIEPEHMIHMAMRDQHRIQMPDLRPQRLLPKIDRCIYKDLLIVILDKYRNPQPLVPWIIRKASLTVTSDRGNSRRC